jgi:hypothetical protein
MEREFTEHITDRNCHVDYVEHAEENTDRNHLEGLLENV